MAEQEHEWEIPCAHCNQTFISDGQAPPAGVLLSEFGRSYPEQNAVAIIEKAFFCIDCAGAHTLLELIDLTYNASSAVEEAKEQVLTDLADHMISDLEQGLNSSSLVDRIRVAAIRHRLSAGQIKELVDHVVDAAEKMIPPAESLRDFDEAQWAESIAQAIPAMNEALDAKLKEMTDG